MVLEPAHEQAEAHQKVNQSGEDQGKVHDLERKNVLTLRPCLIIRLNLRQIDVVRRLRATLNISDFKEALNPSTIIWWDTPGGKHTCELEYNYNNDKYEPDRAVCYAHALKLADAIDLRFAKIETDEVDCACDEVIGDAER